MTVHSTNELLERMTTDILRNLRHRFIQEKEKDVVDLKFGVIFKGIGAYIKLELNSMAVSKK